MRVIRGICSRLAAGFLAAACAGACPGAPIDEAVALFRQKRYADARVILEPLAAAEPSNAAANYYLGMAILRSGGPSCLDNARKLLANATRLSPQNAGYLADYAGVCLETADRDNSLALALEGRDAMTKAIEADPADLAAREGLMQYYAKAPWPLGEPGKALAQAAEIARRDPGRGKADYALVARLFERRGLHSEAHAARRAAQMLEPASAP